MKSNKINDKNNVIENFQKLYQEGGKYQIFLRKMASLDPQVQDVEAINSVIQRYMLNGDIKFKKN